MGNIATPGVPYQRQLILGPVPTHVPRSVMVGEPFYYRQLENDDNPEANGMFKSVKLFAELPFGCKMESLFTDETQSDIRTKPCKIVWTAVINGPSEATVSIHSDASTSGAGATATLETEGEPPIIYLELLDSNSLNEPLQDDFSVTVTAQVKIANAETPPSGPGEPYTYQYAAYGLGSFTTEFKCANLERQAGSFVRDTGKN